MAVVRQYLRNTQAQAIATGTGQGSIWDLADTTGTAATLSADTNNNNTPVRLMSWVLAVGTEITGTSFPTSYEVTAIANTPGFYIRVARLNSAGTLQDASANGTTRTATGTFTETFTLSTTWATGDYLAVELWGYRNAGHSASTVTVGVNRTASYVDADITAAAVTGQAALDGAGLLGATGQTLAYGAAALDGSGLLTGNGNVVFPTVYGAANLAGAGALTAAGMAQAVGSATLAGTGVLTASGATLAYGAGALLGAGNLVGNASATASGEGHILGAGVLAGQALTAALANGNLLGAGLLVGSGTTGVNFQFARPASDITTNGWQVPPLWSKVNEEVENDSPLIYSTDGTVCELALGSIFEPGPGDVTIYVRARKTLVGAADLRVRLMEGASERAVRLLDALTTSRETYPMILTTLERDSIGNWGDLRIRLTRE